MLKPYFYLYNHCCEFLVRQSCIVSFVLPRQSNCCPLFCFSSFGKASFQPVTCTKVMENKLNWNLFEYAFFFYKSNVSFQSNLYFIYLYRSLAFRVQYLIFKNHVHVLFPENDFIFLYTQYRTAYRNNYLSIIFSRTYTITKLNPWSISLVS